VDRTDFTVSDVVRARVLPDMVPKLGRLGPSTIHRVLTAYNAAESLREAFIQSGGKLENASDVSLTRRILMPAHSAEYAYKMAAMAMAALDRAIADLETKSSAREPAVGWRKRLLLRVSGAARSLVGLSTDSAVLFAGRVRCGGLNMKKLFLASVAALSVLSTSVPYAADESDPPLPRFRPWQQVWQCNDIRVTITARDPFSVEYDIGGMIWGGSRFTVIKGDLFFNGRPCLPLQPVGY
jgi:hypothetical protein